MARALPSPLSRFYAGVLVTLNVLLALFVTAGVLSSWGAPDPGETESYPIPLAILVAALVVIGVCTVTGLRLRPSRPVGGWLLLGAPLALFVMMMAATVLAGT